MPNELNSYQYPTYPEPDGNVRGASLLLCNCAAGAGMTAKGQCLFKLPFLHLLHFFAYFSCFDRQLLSQYFHNFSDLRFCLNQQHRFYEFGLIFLTALALYFRS